MSHCIHAWEPQRTARCCGGRGIRPTGIALQCAREVTLHVSRLRQAEVSLPFAVRASFAAFSSFRWRLYQSCCSIAFCFAFSSKRKTIIIRSMTIRSAKSSSFRSEKHSNSAIGQFIVRWFGGFGGRIRGDLIRRIVETQVSWVFWGCHDVDAVAGCRRRGSSLRRHMPLYANGIQKVRPRDWQFAAP